MIDFVYLIIMGILNALSLIVAINLLRETPNYLKSFIIAFLAVLLSVFIPSFIYLPIPFFSVIIGIGIWVLLIKLFFRPSWEHSIAIGIISYCISFALEILGVPGIIRMIIGI